MAKFNTSCCTFSSIFIHAEYQESSSMIKISARSTNPAFPREICSKLALASQNHTLPGSALLALKSVGRMTIYWKCDYIVLHGVKKCWYLVAPLLLCETMHMWWCCHRHRKLPFMSLSILEYVGAFSIKHWFLLRSSLSSGWALQPSYIHVI